MGVGKLREAVSKGDRRLLVRSLHFGVRRSLGPQEAGNGSKRAGEEAGVVG